MEPFSNELILRAIEFIEAANLKFQPNVFPTGRQSIQLEYELPNENYFEIEIYDDKISWYSEINDETEEIENINMLDAIRRINEFHTRF